MINRKIFFREIRKCPLFGGKLTVQQVSEMEAMMNEYERREWSDIEWLAYIMGTAYHETGLLAWKDGKKVMTRPMAPVEETGKGQGMRYGKRVWFDGTPYNDIVALFYGRGHTQNTWRDNYLKLTKAAQKEGFTWDFVKHPELLLETAPSIWATFHAMSTGLYTGRKLSQYLGGKQKLKLWTGARRIINMQDDAEEIAQISKIFYAALQAATI